MRGWPPARVAQRVPRLARAELVDAGIAVPTLYPFVTDTEFIESLRGATESASELESSHASKPQSPEQVAEAILDLIETGAEQADLVPEQFGGSYQDEDCQPTTRIGRITERQTITEQRDW